MGADWLYIADSNGSLFPERVTEIFRELSNEVRMSLGFHAHDSLHLAFANSLAAIRAGGSMLDSSLGGARACPPEDCGGTGGYENFLAAIRDPGHEEHEEMLEWIGGEFDPEEFDLDEFDIALRHIR